MVKNYELLKVLLSYNINFYIIFFILVNYLEILFKIKPSIANFTQFDLHKHNYR